MRAESDTDVLRAALDRLAVLRREFEQRLARAEWESHSHGDTEAIALAWLAVSNVNAVDVLGQTTIHFVIPATAAARSAYEATVSAAWMVEPDDPGERDRRWLGLFMDERSYWSRMIAESREREDSNEIIDLLQREEARVQALLDAVRPQFDAAGLAQPAPLPSMPDRLRIVGQQRFYATYRTACQFVHPATRALNIVRDQADHGDSMSTARYGYRARPHHWTSALILSTESLGFSLDILSGQIRHGQDVYDDSFRAAFNACGEAIRLVAARR